MIYMKLKISEFDYRLPKENIAQTPLEQRDASRLLVLSRHDGSIVHQKFSNIAQYLETGDVLVINNSRVIPARLHGHKFKTGGKVEILLLEKESERAWRVLVGGKRIDRGLTIMFHDLAGKDTGLSAEVTASEGGAVRIIRFNSPVEEYLDIVGHTPLPPYIHNKLADPERYQTVYSRPKGSAAAPTAGLHFTPELLLELRRRGVVIEEITLHVGLDTFKPVDTENVSDHVIHSEWSRLTAESAQRINEAKLAGKRIIAVGTTSVRVLETAALRSAGAAGSLSRISEQDPDAFLDVCAWRPVAAYEGKTDLYIYPGYRFRAVDAMVTNFHLPETSLLLLVSAFAGREKVKIAYETAIEEDYRFYSFGDAMLIL
jgi:S-adenosylmethionine:tRNA ribosyltransferase-isomerase